MDKAKWIRFAVYSGIILFTLVQAYLHRQFLVAHGNGHVDLKLFAWALAWVAYVVLFCTRKQGHTDRFVSFAFVLSFLLPIFLHIW